MLEGELRAEHLFINLCILVKNLLIIIAFKTGVKTPVHNMHVATLREYSYMHIPIYMGWKFQEAASEMNSIKY